MTPGEFLAERGFGLGWSAIRRMPEGSAYATFRVLADRMWRRQGRGVRQLTANLARVLPPDDLDRLPDVAHAGVRSYLRYWCDAFRLPAWTPSRVNATMHIRTGLHRLDEAVDAGTGAILVLPHSGNWDHAGAWASLRYGGIATVAERLKPEGLYDRFVEYRSSLGMEVLGLGDDGVLGTLARRLESGVVVCLLADRDLSRSGVPVQFFGDTASMPAGPALLAEMTGAPLFPVTLWATEDGTGADIHERIGVPELGERPERTAAITQSVADVFARAIGERPSDWHMMQRLWLADLDGARRPAPEPADR